MYRAELFDLIQNPEYVFYKLVIDDVCLFDEFVEELKRMPREYAKLAGLYAIMERFSPRMLSNEQFRQIKGISRSDVFEFKRKPLRVYVVLQRPNVYIITGSVKKEQEKTIKRIDKKIKNFNPDEL